jgi:hypothetical protein
MHESHRGPIARKTAIEIDALNEGAGTIAYANNSNTNLTHGKAATLAIGRRLKQGAKSTYFKGIMVRKGVFYVLPSGKLSWNPGKDLADRDFYRK